ncbi:TOBE domain-containing protein [Deefgea rivuli]|uniref:TOBE domain-containing protein n=1 Tax=Deefgea rivuli TaxID=400948 RepID=UPI000486600C|nr:TOBE domain-containing protein [Deefgea rivuli]
MNRLPAQLQSIEIHGGFAFVAAQCEEHSLSAMLLGISDDVMQWQIDDALELTFAENEVAIAVNLQGEISLRNRFDAVISGIESSPLLSRIAFEFAGQTLHALITRASCERMQLAIGKKIEWLVKSNAMQVRRA